MPRIYSLEEGYTVEEASVDPGNYWEPIDFCRECFEFAKDEANEHDDVDASHPPYESTDGYRCHWCDKLLTERDD